MTTQHWWVDVPPRHLVHPHSMHKGVVREEGDMVDHEDWVREEGDKVDMREG